MNPETFSILHHSHDLRLSAWGPYTKRYMGISHIPDVSAGLRFDLSVFPGLYRRGVQPPNVLWESGYHPWEAAPDLSYFRHRHEVIWKDQVYCNIDFCRLDESAALIRTECVNRTDGPQSLSLYWVASLNFPPLRTYSSVPLQMSRASVPEGGVWVEALDYADVTLGFEPHRATLSYDGLLRGEIRAHGFTGGLGLGQGFGMTPGDSVTYRIALPAPLTDAALVLRYRLPTGDRLPLALSGDVSGDVTLAGSGDLIVQTIPLGAIPAGMLTLTLTPQGRAALELDGFAIVPQAAADQVRFAPAPWNPVPERLPDPRDDTLLLRYEHIPNVYGLAWDGSVSFKVREFYCDDLDTTLRHKVHEHVQLTLTGPGEGHYTNIFSRPVFVEAGATRVLYGLVCTGDADTVSARLAAFDPASPEWDAVAAVARARAVDFAPNPSGEPYRFGQERMAATLLTNIVYPVRTRGAWIRHSTPGRWWDCLYTWDSGFIGLGLAELDLDRALDNLNAYTTEPGTKDAAFIHHGSAVPTQFYGFLELWQRTQSRDFLAYFYPRMQQYHRFMAGRLGSSTTRSFKSNLLRTWDYFYNSGGWDDYPPQVYIHAKGLESAVTPVITTAQVIRTAKIMRMAALALGEDPAEYDADIAALSHDLQTYAWDEEAGYFSYVLHDTDGHPTEILRHESGANFNMGLDGASPLTAGICTPEQEACLVAALMSPERMWCRYGLSTVDQSAPYYRDDGYWNGAVWMAHQWFVWKALLDLGRAAEAHRIAKTALDVWQAEVADSYNCFEHFIVQTGRGAGWHHFGGLSAPVLNWYGAYHRPGRLTVGFDTWIEALTVAPDATALSARLRHFGAPHHAPVALVTLKPGAYTATWNGQVLPSAARYPGTLEVQLPAGAAVGELAIIQNRV
ncbi:MAG TPA: trehalase family glycosidase [Anaerolineae bacterium]|nr:trehalase family glycosidase [Anaerolineae bacterium]